MFLLSQALVLRVGAGASLNITAVFSVINYKQEAQRVLSSDF